VTLVVGGTLLLALGGLFAVGSAGQARRLIIAAVAGVLGSVAIAWGIRMARRARRYSSQGVRDEVLKLAQRHRGEFSLGELEAALGDRLGRARLVLSQLEIQGLCRRQHREGSSFFVFADLQARLAVKACPFCEAELPLESQLASCPKCGGILETEVKRMAASGSDLYRMDDDG